MASAQKLQTFTDMMTTEHGQCKSRVRMIIGFDCKYDYFLFWCQVLHIIVKVYMKHEDISIGQFQIFLAKQKTCHVHVSLWETWSIIKKIPHHRNNFKIRNKIRWNRSKTDTTDRNITWPLTVMIWQWHWHSIEHGGIMLVTWIQLSCLGY